MVSRLYRAEGIVLKTTTMGEGDLQVTLLTRDGSKLRAVAWGARKLTSRKMGHLEPLTRVDLALSKGRDLDSIGQAQSVESFVGLRGNLEATAKAIYLAEMVESFANEGSANPPLYSLFLETLRTLDNYPEMDALVPYCQLNLLKVLGFMPELYQCVECRCEISPGEHRFSVELGGVMCTRCSSGASVMPLSIQALKVLRFFDRSAHSDLTGLRTSDALNGELRSILDRAIRYWLDRDVRSRQFMDHLQRERVKGAGPRR